MTRYFLLIILFIATASLSRAQDDDIKITRIGAEQGFPQTRISGITQDKAGFIWIGTGDGLIRYDGYTFKAYRHNPFDSTSLCGNEVTQVYADTYGLLWITTSKGVNMLNTETNVMRRFPSIMPVRKYPTPSFWGEFYENKDGNIFLLTDSIYVYHRINGVIRTITLPQGRIFPSQLQSFLESYVLPGTYIVALDSGFYQFETTSLQLKPLHITRTIDEHLGSLKIINIFQDRKGILWFFTKSTLYSLDIVNKTFQQFPLMKELLSNWTLKDDMGMCIDDSDKIWIWRTWINHGMTVFDPKTKNFTFLRDIVENGRHDSIAFVDKIINWKNGDIVIQTKDFGLYIRSASNGEWHHFLSQQGTSNSISSNTLHLVKDRSGILWGSTWENGLTKIEYQSKRFLYSKNFLLRDINKDLMDTRSFYEDQTGVVWVGTLYKGLLLLDSTMNVRNQYSFPAVSSIIPASPDSTYLWVGTWHDGLFKLDSHSGQSISYKNQPDDLTSLSDSHVRTVLKDHTGTVWVGTWYSGLNRLIPATEQFVRYQNDSSKETSISNNTVFCLYEDREGVLWVGTQQGLNKYNRESDTFTRFFHDPKNPQSLRSDDIRCITEDKTGTLWIGTNEGGLNKFNRNSGTFSALTTNEGLPNESIYGILEDEKGNLWLSTNNGLCRYSPQTGETRNYDVRDGLQNNEFNTGAYYKSPGGKMYFGGLNGFNVFYPDSIKGNTFIPPVYITDVKVYETSIPFAGKSLTFQDNQDFITFEFVALNYSQPERNQYMIKLDGLDGTWHSIGTRHFASYSHLSPGEYTFSVKGSNNNSEWNPAAASIKFVILPPIWATLWFRGFSALAIIGIGFSMYYWRVSIFKREQKAQQEFSRQLIESQEQERKRIASDLHDSFGQSIMIIMNHAYLGKRKLDDKHSSEKEFDSILNLSSETMEEVRKIIQNLRPIHLDRIGLTKTIIALLEKVGSTSGISVRHEIEKIDALIPKEHEISLYRIIQETFTNIVKHSDATEASVTIIIREKNIIVTLRDNGKGFTVKPTYDHAKNTGFGLAGIKERVNILNAVMTIASNPGDGTVIEVKIPVEDKI